MQHISWHTCLKSKKVIVKSYRNGSYPLFDLLFGDISVQIIKYCVYNFFVNLKPFITVQYSFTCSI